MDLFGTGIRPVSVFLNGQISKRRVVELHREMTFRDIIADCVRLFKLPAEGNYRLFDAQGGELDTDDIEFLTSDEPLFLSKGEPFLPSSSLSLYEEVKVLGRGGFGTVKLCEHRLTKALVAVKFVDMEHIATVGGMERVYKEVQILRTLHHANIVDLKDAFSAGRHMCFVMEYCKGGELRKYLDETGPLPEDQVYSIAFQLLDGIRYCHNSGVIHRDLKLENILFADSLHTHIKIVDFGISGMFCLGASTDSSGAGSIRYLAPEVLSGDDTSSQPALDIWSIGCILYSLLTGNLPFDGLTRAEITEKIRSVSYKPLPMRVSQPWHHVIHGTLHKSAYRRWTCIRIDEFLRTYRNATTFSTLSPMSSSSSSSQSSDNEEENPRERLKLGASLKQLGKSQSRVLEQRKTVILPRPPMLGRRVLSPVIGERRRGMTGKKGDRVRMI